jgi:ferredoxin
MDGGLMKITVERPKCEGHGKCVEVASKVFKLDEKFISVVIDAKGDTDQRILLAAKVCPTKAIILEEEGTGKRLFP